jgi:hypothetical protein
VYVYEVAPVGDAEHGAQLAEHQRRVVLELVLCPCPAHRASRVETRRAVYAQDAARFTAPRGLRRAAVYGVARFTAPRSLRVVCLHSCGAVLSGRARTRYLGASVGGGSEAVGRTAFLVHVLVHRLKVAARQLLVRASLISSL